MKLLFLKYWTFLVTVLFFACKHNTGDSEIKNYRRILQPHLTEIVSHGIVYLGNEKGAPFIIKNATDMELMQLSKSEHPVLRATALRTMLERNSFNHLNLIMKNLADTAVVAIDNGEFGIGFSMISDYIIHNASWRDTIARNKTINTIIINHNYLKSAYEKLLTINPQEKYYNQIKLMATRKTTFDYEYNHPGAITFYNIEQALYALAKFNKKEDIPIIKESILSNYWRCSDLSFKLMKEYPNEEYLEIFEEFYPRNFYINICREKNNTIVEEFINSIAIYKNKSSEKILNQILNRNPFLPCNGDSNTLKYTLSYAIWENNCDSYLNIREQIKSNVANYEKNKIEPISIEAAIPEKNISLEPIHWWSP